MPAVIERIGHKMPIPNQADRRKKPRSQDTLFRLVVGLNILSWAVLVASLIVFHFARPDFISGVQAYWGVEGRSHWSQQHVDSLITLLQVCLVSTLVSLILRSKRNRRKNDAYGINLFILAGISLVSLVTLTLNVS